MSACPAVAVVEVTEEAAYPNSILDDPAAREAFLSERDEEDAVVTDEMPPGFWKRQFSATPTAVQKRFDWTFSVLLPVICFAFDPFVFRTYGEGPGMLGSFAPIAIPLSYTAVMAMMLWLLMGKRLGRFAAYLAALFALCSVVSLAIGVVLFPFSLIGLMAIIGVLGFTPLCMSFSLWRNAVRAYRAADTKA